MSVRFEKSKMNATRLQCGLDEINRKNEDGIEKWKQKKKYSMYIW